MKQKELVEKMTLEEKAAILSGKTVWQTREISRLGIPSIFCADGPHGIRKQAGAGDHLGLNASLPATCFPTAATVANSWDTELAWEIGKALGEEASAQGVQVLLGPGLNIKRSPLCGRNFEYFSEDPYISGKMAAAYVKGIQSQGVAACPKHFAVNSQELRRMAMNAVVDERTLREIYLTGFEIAVKEGKAAAIMSSYNEVNGEYANENRHLL
ncbi:MAG: glycoside hydrolase family 3 protein, partial [Clostridium sp.]|nr:glycoside hydrolase family 3 protein [Clostridium sp.]